MLDPGLVDALTSAFEEVAETEGLGRDMIAQADESPDVKHEERASGRFKIWSFIWHRFPAVERLGRAGPFAEIAARLMGSTRLNFYGDQLFLKEQGSLHRTAFHQDAPYFNLTGDQCCTMWMPLDPVRTGNSVMGYVRGSHRWKIYAANDFVSQRSLPGSSEEPLPDIEGNETDYDIVYYEAEPGDIIVHHVRTVHGSTAASTAGRRTLALRYAGDDVRYLARPAAPALRADSLRDGDRLDSAEFPLVWTKDGGILQTRSEEADSAAPQTDTSRLSN
jgi:ectoine hydroxylase-related dioxygenase (phytanoyl-CoA dioxygenase family)